MRQALVRRLVHLEERCASHLKPWLVLMPGEEPPAGWQVTHGGIVRVQIFDGRRVLTPARG